MKRDKLGDKIGNKLGQDNGRQEDTRSRTGDTPSHTGTDLGKQCETLGAGDKHWGRVSFLGGEKAHSIRHRHISETRPRRTD